MATFVCILLLLFALATSKTLFRRGFNPPVVFFAVWSVTLVLYVADQKFVGVFKPVSTIAEWIFVSSFAFFAIGSLVGAFPRAGMRTRHDADITPSDLRVLDRTSNFLVPVLALCVVARLFIVLQRYGNPLTHLYLIRHDYVSGQLVFPFGLSFISTFLGYFLVLNLGVLATIQKRIGIKLLTISVVVLVFLTDFAAGNRAWSLNLFCFLGSTVLVTYSVVLGKRIRLKAFGTMAVWMIAFISMVNIIFCLRSNGTTTFLRSISVDTFQYTAGEISSTGYFIEKPFPVDFPGYYTFGGLIKLVDDVMRTAGAGFLTPKDPDLYLADILNLPYGAFNSSTHLAFYYADFGATGVLVISFLLGFLSTYLFLRVEFRGRVIDIQLSAITFAMILFSIRGIHSEGRFFWILLAVLFMQQRVLNRVSRRYAAVQPRPAC